MDSNRYFDTHCNVPNILQALKINFAEVVSFNDLERVFQAPCLAGIVSVSSDSASHDDTLSLASRLNNVYGAYGIHPLYTYEYTQDEERKKIEAMNNPKTVAWGEIGLDYHDFGPKYSYSTPEQQKPAFISQIKHALDCKKPIIIHTREAEEDTFQIMKEYIPKDWKLHVHCYTDSLNLANLLMQEWPNLWIGFTGAITFKNSNALREVVKGVPLDRIVLETDGPFMSPEPYRGKVCHPGYIPPIAKKIAELHATTPELVYEWSRKNTTSLFGIQ